MFDFQYWHRLHPRPLAQKTGHDLTGLNCNYSIRGNISNPRANGKKSINRRFSFSPTASAPRGRVLFIGQRCRLFGRCGVSSALSIRVARHRLDSIERSYRISHSMRRGMSGIAYLLYRGFQVSVTFCWYFAISTFHVSRSRIESANAAAAGGSPCTM